ncbi:ABC transporter ATP-binding protein [Tautonia marina]|uniref:ABC transporter ATP-binding protein n=1 Tax=Tautonia marina TaxID=2653855 RepID=UPI001260AE06|nr:ABC transporter ATP-binding protein [Tautonia marina]
MSSDVILRAEGVSKKFCRSLKHAMWYGCGDIVRDTIGVRSRCDQLRNNEFWAVDDVSFELHRGECLGLVGPNGAGKSTLFKMLNGILRPDRGTIRYRGRMGALIEVGAGFHPQLTGRENIYVNGAILGMSRREIDRKLDAIIAFADIGDFLETPIRFYSSGMMVRLGMAVAVHTEPEILLIDEVFAVGDMNFQAKCYNKIGQLRRNGTTFILVSHNIHHIGAFSNRVMVLDHGRILTCGPTTEAIASYIDLMNGRLQDQQAQMQSEELPVGTGRIEFCGASVCDEDGRAIEQISATEPVQLRLDYRSQVLAENCCLDVNAYSDKLSGPFLQTSSHMVGELLRIEPGSGTLVVNFPCFPVNGGKLVFSVSLWSHGRQELFSWLRLPPFKIEGHPLSSGAAWLPCSIQSYSKMFIHKS